MKILVTPTSLKDTSTSKALTQLKSFADEIVYNPYNRPLLEGELIEMLSGVTGIIAGLDYITGDVIDKAPSSLKAISRYGSGYDRVDIKAAGKKGILVTNTPSTNTTAVAELTMALLLSVARKIPFLDHKLREGAWIRSSGLELNNKYIGIIGLGAIGKKVALLSKGFNLNVITYDSCCDQAFVEEHGLEVLNGLDDLLEMSDIITLHIPLTEATRQIIQKDNIAKMKNGVILINTSRGELIKEEDLIEALISGKIRGLGLDVFCVEPPINNPLLSFENVVVTPHTGAHTQEAIEAMASLAITNLISVIQKGDSPYVVNREYLV